MQFSYCFLLGLFCHTVPEGDSVAIVVYQEAMLGLLACLWCFALYISIKLAEIILRCFNVRLDVKRRDT